MTLTLLGLNMVKYLVGTERAKAHACSDTLRQGESPKVSAHGAPGLRARIRPCAFQFSLPSADCVVRRTGQRLFARDSPDAPWIWSEPARPLENSATLPNAQHSLLIVLWKPPLKR